MFVIKVRIIAADADLSFELWLEIIRVVVYLYNYILSKFTLGGNGEELISLIIFFFWELDIGCFSLLHHMEYCYFRVYRCRAFIYILKNMRVQSQKLIKRAEKDFLVGYKDNSIYWIWLLYKWRV